MKKILLILALMPASCHAQEYSQKPHIPYRTKIAQRKELLICIESNELLNATNLLYEGVNPNRTSPHLAPAVIRATYLADSSMLKLLLDYNADPNKRDWLHDNVALTCAVDQSKENMVQELLAKKADPNLSNSSGNTALLIACKRFNPRQPSRKIIEMLLAAGACPNICNKNRKTPLHYTCVTDLTLTQLLIQKGARVNHADNKKYTPLHKAVIAYVHIENNPHPTEADQQNQIQLAAIIKVLIDAGACPDAQNKFKISARELGQGTAISYLFSQKEISS